HARCEPDPAGDHPQVRTRDHRDRRRSVHGVHQHPAHLGRNGRARLDPRAGRYRAGPTAGGTARRTPADHTDGGQVVITLPRRSVTRFFIPLIDVLILLFCIFLLMPFVSGTPEPEPEKKSEQPKEKLPENVVELQKQLSEAKARIERMEKASQTALADRL